MPKYPKEARQIIRREIQRALIPKAGKWTNRDGRLFYWFIKRLDHQAAMIFAGGTDDKQLIHWIYAEGRTYREVSNSIGIPESTIRKRISQVFIRVIGKMPYSMAAEIMESHLQGTRGLGYWRLKDCEHCGGDLYFEDIREGKDVPSWVCLQCGRRFPHINGV